MVLSGLELLAEKLKLTLDYKLYGVDPQGEMYGKKLGSRVVSGYKDYEFQYWMIEDHKILPDSWEPTGRIEQKLLEVGTAHGTP